MDKTKVLLLLYNIQTLWKITSEKGQPLSLYKLERTKQLVKKCPY